MILAVSMPVTPVKDTVWWNTVGGQVTEHRDQARSDCSLSLYSDQGSVAFTWDDPGALTVTAVARKWQFPDGWHVPLAMQVGDAWLSNGGDSAVIQAVGHGHAASFIAKQPVEDLLPAADHIEVRTGTGSLVIALDRARVGGLLAGAQRCRAALGR